MKIQEIPSNTEVYICEHVFSRSALPMLFAREQSGELVATCGCEVRKAHLVGFWHLVKYFNEIKKEEMPSKGFHFAKDPNTGCWGKGTLER